MGPLAGSSRACRTCAIDTQANCIPRGIGTATCQTKADIIDAISGALSMPGRRRNLMAGWSSDGTPSAWLLLATLVGWLVVTHAVRQGAWYLPAARPAERCGKPCWLGLQLAARGKIEAEKGDSKLKSKAPRTLLTSLRLRWKWAGSV
jgi:hypothetical protein